MAYMQKQLRMSLLGWCAPNQHKWTWHAGPLMPQCCYIIPRITLLYQCKLLRGSNPSHVHTSVSPMRLCAHAVWVCNIQLNTGQLHLWWSDYHWTCCLMLAAKSGTMSSWPWNDNRLGVSSGHLHSPFTWPDWEVLDNRRTQWRFTRQQRRPSLANCMWGWWEVGRLAEANWEGPHQEQATWIWLQIKNRRKAQGSTGSRKEKAHKHKQAWGIVPGLGGQPKICLCVFCGPFLMGEKTYKQNPPKNRGTILWNYYIWFFFLLCFCSQLEHATRTLGQKGECGVSSATWLSSANSQQAHREICNGQLCRTKMKNFYRLYAKDVIQGSVTRIIHIGQCWMDSS